MNRSSKAQFRAGLLKVEHILSEYCDASRLLRSFMGISFASTCKLVAGVGWGTGLNDDSMSVAKEALTFTVVGVNDAFKVPAGYFLIDGLGGMERANLVT